MSLAFSRGGRPSELEAYQVIDIECEDCGRTRRMQRRAIAEAIRNGAHTLIELHNKLYCSACRERGAPGRNVNLYPRER